MSEIKAIETVYNGYRFRSRLEARWAVFFDALGIEWEYEPEGIVLSDGSFYLPDFYLPQFFCYFEVKRKGISDEEKEAAIHKISDGMKTDSWAGLICFGDPMDDDLHIYCQETDDGGGGSYESEVTIGLYRTTDKPYLFSYEDRRERCFFNTFGENVHGIPMVTREYGEYDHYDFVSEDVKSARLAARQVRFEHGETPSVR